jgi:hypothetical protein
MLFLVGGHPLPEFGVVEEHFPDGFADFGSGVLAGLLARARNWASVCVSAGVASLPSVDATAPAVGLGPVIRIPCD